MEEILLEARTVDVELEDAGSSTRHSEFICGLRGFSVQLQQHLQLSASTCVKLKVQHFGNSPRQEIEFLNFPPGSIIVFQYVLPFLVDQTIACLLINKHT